MRRDWDDFGYRTTFDLYLQAPGRSEYVGTVKIAHLDMVASFAKTIAYTPLEPTFLALGPDYYSLGQEASYYERLMGLLGRVDTVAVLEALRDLTVTEVSDEAITHSVVSRSLMRSVTWRTVEDQFRSTIQHGVSAEPFELTYFHDPSADGTVAQTTFKVNPERNVPGTFQVIIGANGAGKSRMLRNMVAAFRTSAVSPPFVLISDQKRISNLILVRLSPFELPLSPNFSAVTGMTTLALQPHSPESSLHEWQREQFLLHVGASESSGRSVQLMTAIATLAQSDRELASLDLDSITRLRELDYDSLSSGHKIVLLVVAGLVANCHGQTAILIDEPESHLHPPLLAGFVKAVSDLVASTNSLAVVATHSPVVLQQVPREHARKIWRREGITEFRDIRVETFGENIGTLTREVFGVELESSGHFARLREVAASSSSYEEALALIGFGIGEEAKLVLRALTATAGEE